MHLFRQLGSTIWQLPSTAESGWGVVRGAGDWAHHLRGSWHVSLWCSSVPKGCQPRRRSERCIKSSCRPQWLEKADFSVCPVVSPNLTHLLTVVLFQFSVITCTGKPGFRVLVKAPLPSFFELPVRICPLRDNCYQG